MTESSQQREEFKVRGDEVLKKVKSIIAEGNARRILIQNETGDTLLEIPVTLAVVGAVFAPVLAAVGALAGIVTNCKLIVEKRTKKPPAG
jgi:hypothetical protein